MGSNQLRCSHYSCSFLSQNLFLACFSAHTKTKIYIKSNKYEKKQVTNWPKKNSIDNTTRFRDLLFHKSYFDKTCLRAPWRDHTLLIFWLVQWSFCVLSVSRGVSTIVCPNICFDVCGVFFFSLAVVIYSFPYSYSTGSIWVVRWNGSLPMTHKKKKSTTTHKDK